MNRNIEAQNKNPFCIPDLTPMYERVKEFVKEHQGEKGYILTDNEENDTIWTFVYNDMMNSVSEFEVKAVRVKNNMLQILYDDSYTKYKEDDISDSDEYDWSNDIQYDDCVYYIQTIFSLAESIQEYV